MDDLNKLIPRAQRGELEAYDRIVRRFQDMAVGYGYSLLHDFQWAEDAAQEAFVQAYLDLPALRDPMGFPGWFRKIVFKQCDRITRRKRVQTVSMEWAKEITCPASQPAQAMEEAERNAFLYTEIQNLPANEREAITLFYLSGHSQEEMCGFLEIPVTTIKKRLQTARRRLKEKMMETVEGELKKQAPSRDGQFADEIAEAMCQASVPNPDHDTSKMVWYQLYVALDDAAKAGRPLTGGQRAVFNALLKETQGHLTDDAVLQAVPEARRSDTADSLRLSAGLVNHCTCRGDILGYACVLRDMNSFYADLAKIAAAKPGQPAPDNVVIIFNAFLSALKTRHPDDAAVQAIPKAVRKQSVSALAEVSSRLRQGMEDFHQVMTDAEKEQPF